MKIHVHLDESYKELEIHLYAATYSETIEKILNELKEVDLETMIGYIDEDIHIIKVSDIYAVLSEDAKVYLQTEEYEYETKYKLYEIEEKYRKSFARINKSTLIHLDHLQMIQKKLGKTEVILLNEVSFPIGRKYLTTLKQKLGIGRGK